MTSLAPDIGEARRFIDMIAPDGNALFQTFDDDEERKARRLARTTRDFGELPGLNAKRAGIFITVNAISGLKRGTAHVALVRALFADFDGVELPEIWDIEPSIIVNTSPGKFHVYWLCEGYPKGEFEAAQKAIAARYGTDPVVHDLSRVMRIPGFWHQKKDAYQARIIEATGEMHDVETLRAWIARIAPKPEPKPEYKAKAHVNGGTHPYVKAAYERAIEAIRSAAKGSRNVTLNREAHGVFGFVKGGHLPETVRADLEGAAVACGLTKSEIRTTLESAWRSAEIRDPPPPRTINFRKPAEETAEPEPPGNEPEPEKKPRSAMPFRMLGYNKEIYFYLPEGKQQVVQLKAHEHTALRLLQIADINYWENLGEPGLSEKKWQQIANGLIQSQHQEGIFEETRMRGRGAWMDAKRVVVHTGSEVIVDKSPVALTRINSRFVYEAAPPWEFGFSEPAKSSEANRLVQVCERLTWEHKLSGALLAGWCVVAPVSGALFWRPHIWITGSTGSGKTTAQNDIVGRVVGPAAERFDGKTTEAAVRQTLMFDARPVLIDEAEGEDIAGIQRMQGILDLARVSSSGGSISKGGASHRAVRFVVRSCFCFSSIHTALKFQADESRVTKLVLLPNTSSNRDRHYSDLMRDIREWFTPEFASRMFARTVEYLPVLLKNAEVFTNAAAIIFKNRRAADQVGPMLAGYYLCHSSSEITPEKAVELIHRHKWNDHLMIDSGSDETRLFEYLMSRRIKVVLERGSIDVTIGHACEEARIENGDRKKPYTMALGSYGVRVENGEILISYVSPNLRELFRDAPQWAMDWKRPLAGLPGAYRTTGGVRFGPGLNCRAIVLPYGLLDGTYSEREPGEEG